MSDQVTRQTSQYIDNKEHDALFLAKRITDVGSDDQMLIDKSVTNITYIGRAGRLVATSNTGWILTKVDKTASPTSITHAIDAWDNAKTTAVYG